VSMLRRELGSAVSAHIGCCVDPISRMIVFGPATASVLYEHGVRYGIEASDLRKVEKETKLCPEWEGEREK